MDSSERRLGWVSQPNSRGTFDIVWGCAFTLTLSSWSILYPNIPRPNETSSQCFRRKLWLTALCFLGPEFITLIAFGQWISARRSRQRFHESGYRGWSLTHAFFADMGGFVLHTIDWVPFPVDAEQLHYLVKKGYVQYPKVTKRDLKDRNKSDSIVRAISLCQTLWFLVQLCVRRAQNLAITCLELTTAAFIIGGLAISFFWFQKPADIRTAVLLKTSATIANILREAGESANDPYQYTPLDFVSRREWPASKYWSNWINILRNMGIHFGEKARPITAFPTTMMNEIPPKSHFFLFAFTAVYCGIFVTAWNYTFPTPTERIIWRICSVANLGCLIATWCITDFGFNRYPLLKDRCQRFFGFTGSRAGQARKRRFAIGSSARRIDRVAACIRNNDVSKDPQLDVPLTAILPIYVVAVIYCHARTFTLIEDVIELRSLPASAFQTIDWTQIIPHI